MADKTESKPAATATPASPKATAATTAAAPTTTPADATTSTTTAIPAAATTTAATTSSGPVPISNTAASGDLTADGDADNLVVDNDSAVSVSDEQLSSASLRSSILNYETEGGRRYHAHSRDKYLFPSDEGEQERFEIQEYLLFLVFDGRKYFCPGGDTATRVLDMGTGFGLWAVDYADEHPQATVIGVDLAPIQPSFVPVNLKFEIDDLEKEWTWSKPFDYILCRMMMGSFMDWDGIYKKSFNNLSPGGWMEVIEFTFPFKCDDGSLPADSAYAKWIKVMDEVTMESGRPFRVAHKEVERMEANGFINIHRKVFKAPIGPWAKGKRNKEIGTWALADFDSGLEAFSLAFLTRYRGMSADEITTYMSEVRKDMRNPAYHTSFGISVCYGQKPE